jgi:hypothetical protein
LSPVSKNNSRRGGVQNKPGNIEFYKLFMLYLHAAIDSGLKLEDIFRNLRQKCGGDYIFGKAFIVDVTIDIVEKLDSLIFYMNSLSDGRDVDLYYRLDRLKSNLNRYLDKSEPGRNSENDRGKTSDEGVSLPDLLSKILDYSTRVSIDYNNISSIKTENIDTAYDLLIFCYHRIFDVMIARFQTLISAAENESGRSSSILRIPISYLMQDKEVLIDDQTAIRTNPSGLYSNPGATGLCEGINEISDSEFYAPFLEKSYKSDAMHGLLFYSNETLALYHVSRRFKCIIAANVCDSIGGNYINLLASSTSESQDSILSHKLFGKLLDWLDFRSSSGYGFTMASIGNMNRNDMENHLNMLGKLLEFMASTATPARDEKSVQENIEVFLENIV